MHAALEQRAPARHLGLLAPAPELLPLRRVDTDEPNVPETAVAKQRTKMRGDRLVEVVLGDESLFARRSGGVAHRTGVRGAHEGGLFDDGMTSGVQREQRQTAMRARRCRDHDDVHRRLGDGGLVRTERALAAELQSEALRARCVTAGVRQLDSADLPKSAAVHRCRPPAAQEEDVHAL